MFSDKRAQCEKHHHHHHQHTPQSVCAEALDEDTGAQREEDDAGLALELRGEREDPGEQHVVQLEAISLVERERSVQEGVRQDQPAAHVVYSVLCAQGQKKKTPQQTKMERAERAEGAHTPSARGSHIVHLVLGTHMTNKGYTTTTSQDGEGIESRWSTHIHQPRAEASGLAVLQVGGDYVGDERVSN